MEDVGQNPESLGLYSGGHKMWKPLARQLDFSSHQE